MPVLFQPLYHPQPVPWDNGIGQNGCDAPTSPTSAAEHPSADAEILRQARQEGYEAGYRDGFLAGQQEGYRHGIAAASKQFQQEREEWHRHIQHLTAALGDALRSELASLMARTEELLTELALEIARKVVEVEITSNPEVVRHAVSQALQELRGGTVTVRVNPDDFVLLEQHINLLDLSAEGVTVRLVPDESVERGGVVAESEQGAVDLQPTTKFALLRTEVL
ncbi:Flagellar assembly protein FliH [bacterium HR17]|uniref:Flagellar assembly protein FliH n=1 Tax=Candidatus Fervidibacter japonicus TaxID=2035412 RepID=A0A2H5XCT5_9BACT|nr:Flagellar assembly protein FliH [bacterium HR17]